MAQKFDKLFRKMSPEAQKRVEERAKAEYQALALAELREAQDLTQVELAEKLGIDQGAVSKIERRTDMYLSTLRNVIQAMGGQLELTACFPTGRVRVLTFRDADRFGRNVGNGAALTLAAEFERTSHSRENDFCSRKITMRAAPVFSNTCQRGRRRCGRLARRSSAWDLRSLCWGMWMRLERRDLEVASAGGRDSRRRGRGLAP